MLVLVTIFNLPEWKKLSSSAKAILLYMIVRADSKGICWPSLLTIADDMSKDRKTVILAAAELESVGFIKCIKTPGRVNRYQIIPVPNPSPVVQIPVGKTEPSSTQNGTTPVPKRTPEQIHEQIINQYTAPLDFQAEKKAEEIRKKVEAGQELSLFDFVCLSPEEKNQYEKRGDHYVKKQPSTTTNERTP